MSKPLHLQAHAKLGVSNAAANRCKGQRRKPGGRAAAAVGVQWAQQYALWVAVAGICECCDVVADLAELPGVAVGVLLATVDVLPRGG